MILEAKIHRNAKGLARHFMDVDAHGHAVLHALRGFMSDDLQGALCEADIIAKRAGYTNHLLAVSLHPPPYAKVSDKHFEQAVEHVEAGLRLTDQPRAIIFHEQNGQRHAHAVWSRVDTTRMRMITVAFQERRLRDISRRLFARHGWIVPENLQDHSARDPFSLSLSEWRQAKRNAYDLKVIRAVLRECWESSDTRPSFEAALRSRGFWLARADRGGFVAVDWRGAVHSLPFVLGVAAKELQARLGSDADLSDENETKADIGARLSEKIRDWAKEAEERYQRMRLYYTLITEQMAVKQSAAREVLREGQAMRWQGEELTRASETPRGLVGVLSRITGRASKILERHEAEIARARMRDLIERRAMGLSHVSERKKLRRMVARIRQHHADTLYALAGEAAIALGMGHCEGTHAERPDRGETALKIGPSPKSGRE